MKVIRKKIIYDEAFVRFSLEVACVVLKVSGEKEPRGEKGYVEVVARKLLLAVTKFRTHVDKCNCTVES